MKNIKRFSILALVLVLAIGILTACGGGGSDESADKTIKVAATPSPHAEVLEFVKDTLAEEGWDLEIQVYDDYVTENPATVDGDVDANYFQHIPYLEAYNEETGTNLVVAANIHYEPMQIHAGTKDSCDALEDGDKVAVPNDTTNEARALLLLEANGVIKLKEDAGITATKADIVENPKNLEIYEVEAATIPSVLPDVAIGVINANYAIGNGLKSEDAIAVEAADSLSADTYVNVLVTTEENKDSEKTKALVAALQTDEVKKFIEEKYQGAVLPKF